ncbi:MAG TPA: hypothetical protein VHT51_11885 [Micropepsaceae bacterium]|jgi:hypothetical protein|nr:hypothetical protein [Micropepsaceae bacterium]
MIRTLNFAFIAITSLVCLGVYRTAEHARVDQAELKAAQMAIVRENSALTVLGAEWARLTQPARIQALTQRHLDLSDQPAVELSSLSQLPSKNAPLVAEGDVRNAKVVVQTPSAPLSTPAVAPQIQPVPTPVASFAAFHTGT